MHRIRAHPILEPLIRCHRRHLIRAFNTAAYARRLRLADRREYSGALRKVRPEALVMLPGRLKPRPSGLIH
jgi:hypothetical protein